MVIFVRIKTNKKLTIEKLTSKKNENLVGQGLTIRHAEES
jgi:hypothetical protein